MSTRLLSACAVSVLLLLALMAVAYPLRQAVPGWTTPAGVVEPLDLLAIAVAMAAGGATARHGFRWPAAALVLFVGLASSIVAFGLAPVDAGVVARWLARNTFLPLLLSAVVAWAAAMVGERMAARWLDRQAPPRG